MKFLKNAWYAARWSEMLSPEQLVPLTIISKRLVLFRDLDGTAVAMDDLCPHRLAPLSLGRLLPDGNLQCGYHGLEFNATGSCVRNPHGKGIIPSGCKVRTYPVEERHTMLWIWMGDDAPDPATIPEYGFLDPQSGLDIVKRDVIHMQSGYRYIVDNLLDLSHGPFLHPGVLGNDDTIPADISVKSAGHYVYVHREMRGVRPPQLMDLLFKGDGERVNMPQTIRWSPPSALLNHTQVYSAGTDPDESVTLLGAHILTPETENTTHYFAAAARQGKVYRALDAVRAEEVGRQIAALRRYAFEEQDDPMLRAQQRNVVDNPDKKPIMLEIDMGPIRCNRILDALIEAEDPAVPGSAA